MDDADLAFVLTQVSAAIGVTQRIISSDKIHPHVRAEQERSLVDLESARAELIRAPGP
ncbi:hypothetical protein JOE59_003144 [Agromyces cerinus]|uniref:hypothetical protein n=1 Tax=Agromyces cerinus TaxID=33878 RepID=UPI001956E29A|nr:hypothetical protein [Agromyces cerinus]MBM7832439.1 hypothetical protein [Agromyces cerinus]